MKYSLKEVYGFASEGAGHPTRELMENYDIDCRPTDSESDDSGAGLLSVTQALAALSESIEEGKVPNTSDDQATPPAPVSGPVRDDEVLRRWRDMAGL